MSETQARKTIILLAVLVEGGMVVVAWTARWFMDPPPLAQIQWRWWDVLRGVVCTVPLVLLALALLRWPIGPFARLRRFTHELLVPMLAPCTLVDLLGISALAGLGEELLFRGVFQSCFCLWVGNFWGTILASILFGLLHAITLTYALLAGVMGLYLGWLWLWTGNLLVPIIVHGLYDFVLLWYLLYGPGTPPELLQRDENQPLPPDNQGEE